MTKGRSGCLMLTRQYWALLGVLLLASPSHAEQRDIADLLRLTFQTDGASFAGNAKDEKLSDRMSALLAQVPPAPKATQGRLPQKVRREGSAAVVDLRTRMLTAALEVEPGEAPLAFLAQVFLIVRVNTLAELEQMPMLIAIAREYPKTWEAAVAKLLLAEAMSAEPQAIKGMLDRMEHEMDLLRTERSASYTAFCRAFCEKEEDGFLLRYFYLRMCTASNLGDTKAAADWADEAASQVKGASAEELKDNARRLRAGDNIHPVGSLHGRMAAGLDQFHHAQMKDWLDRLSK